MVNDRPINARFYIVNYESIDKLEQVYTFLKHKRDIGIIVDESHNFRNANASRVKDLINLSKTLNCKDNLFMSGTPIKALGSEMIPMLKMLDPLFDDNVQEQFAKAFGLSVETSIDILKNRLGMMMYRKTKSEVLHLPEKTRHDIKVKVPNSEQYTLEMVKRNLFKYIEGRKEYYKNNLKSYYNDFNTCMTYLQGKLGEDEDFGKYKYGIDNLQKYGYSKIDPEVVKFVKWMNTYEKETLIPLLPTDLKNKFKSSKAVVKYLDLKIMGEALGGFLDKLRSQMYGDIVKNAPICDIIHNAKKKTILFTTYVDVVKIAEEHLKKSCHMNSLSVFGETSKNVLNILNDFRSNNDVNALIATIQTLSTGVTLTEANTVIFLNKPWRHADVSQAEDRVHRIGQDTEVFIYNVILDTGEKPNLSTRLEDVVNWSKEMFEGIVGDENVSNLDTIARGFLKS